MPTSTGSPTPTFCSAGFESGIEIGGQRCVARAHARFGSRSGEAQHHARDTSGAGLPARRNLFDRVQFAGHAGGRANPHAPSRSLVAMRIDPRFDDDGQFPNRWLPLERDEAGTAEAGHSRTPITRRADTSRRRGLHKPAGAVLVEYHLAFDEPAGWFSGANLLRSKLPIVCQDGVRKFRRRLATP